MVAAARLAEDNEELAFAHVEVHALEDLDLRVALAEDLGDAAQRDDGLLFLRKAEVQALVVDGDGREHGQILAEVHVRVVVERAVLLVNYLDAADDLIFIDERHADHALCDKTGALIKASGPAGIALAVLDDGGLALFDDLARDALALGEAHSGEVGAANGEGGVNALVAL